MPSANLIPTAYNFQTTPDTNVWVDESGATTGAALTTAVADNSDSTYVQWTPAASLSGTADIGFNFTTTPSDLVTVTAVSVTVRAQYFSSKDSGTFSVTITDKNGNPLTNSSPPTALTTSPANYGVSLTLIGATDKATWDQAVLVLSDNAVESSADQADFYIKLTISLTYSNVPPPQQNAPWFLFFDW